MVEVYGTGASPRAGGDGGSGEQARPAVEGARQLHAAGVVARKRAVSSSSGFPDTLDGLCTGHLSSRLNHTQKTCTHTCKIHTHMCSIGSDHCCITTCFIHNIELK